MSNPAVYDKLKAMAKKENKTNAMRKLDTLKIPYKMHTYECDEFIDAGQIADMLSLDHNLVYKTLVTRGHSKAYYVMKKQFVTRISETAKSLEQMIVSGGRLGMQLELAPSDLAKASGAEFADIIQ